MAIFYFSGGKTFADVDQVRATVGAPIGITGSTQTYDLLVNYTRSPAWSGFEVEMTGRYIHAGVTEWENRSCTGVN